MKLIIRIITVLILANCYLFGLGPASIGKIAPDFRLKELKSGKYISLQDYRGKIVVLDFWASWCSSCKESLPELAKIDSENHTLKVLAVNVDDNKERAIKFLNKFPVDQAINIIETSIRNGWQGLFEEKTKIFIGIRPFLFLQSTTREKP